MPCFIVHIPYPCAVYKVVGVCLSGVSLSGRFHTHSVWERAGCPLHFAKWHFLPLHTPDYALNCCLATIWTGPKCCDCVCVCCFSVHRAGTTSPRDYHRCLPQVCINDGLLAAINSRCVHYCQV